jgi:hypothetical protein
MYGFILNMWIMKKVTAEKVQSYVPKYISQEECDMILATPQNPDLLAAVTEQVTEQ